MIHFKARPSIAPLDLVTRNASLLTHVLHLKTTRVDSRPFVTSIVED